MSRKKYRYKKETAQNDGVTVIDENNDNVPEALEIDGHREDFVEVKELDETEPRPKGYEEITEEETASRAEGDTVVAGDTHTGEEGHHNAEEPSHSDAVPQPIADVDTHANETTDAHPASSVEMHTETHENSQGADSHDTAHTTDDQAGVHAEEATHGVDVRPGSEEARREENTVGLQPTQPEGSPSNAVTEGDQTSMGVAQPAPEARTETTHNADPLVPDVRPAAPQDSHVVDTASSAQEPPAVVSPDSTVSQPQPPVGASEDHHVDTQPTGEVHRENEVRTEEHTEQPPVSNEVVSPSPAVPEKHEDVGATVPSSAPAVDNTGVATATTQTDPAARTEEVNRPYEAPLEGHTTHVEETHTDTPPQNHPSETVTVETATGPAPEEHEHVVSPGTHDSVAGVGGVGTESSVDTSPVQPEHLGEGTQGQPAPQGEPQPALDPASSFAMTIKKEMENYCAAMGPGVMQTERSLVKNQVDLYYIFMKVLNVQDLDKFELGIKAIFTVMYQNKASCFDFNMRYRGIVDIPASTLKDDEVEVLTALIDLFCRLVDTEDLYTVGRTYNFNTLQRHLTDQFVLSRFLGFVRRIVGAA